MLSYTAAILTGVITLTAAVGNTWDTTKKSLMEFTRTGWIVCSAAILLLITSSFLFQKSANENASIVSNLNHQLAEHKDQYNKALKENETIVEKLKSQPLN